MSIYLASYCLPLNVKLIFEQLSANSKYVFVWHLKPRFLLECEGEEPHSCVSSGTSDDGKEKAVKYAAEKPKGWR